MSAVYPTMNVAEFEARYGCDKPYYEFWYGEAIQKSMPTWIHGLLQRIVMELLQAAGWKTGSEVKLKIDPELQPVPDIVATMGRIETPYPTKALEIVVEILSDDDPMFRLLNKCRVYQDWGFQQIYIVDPGARQVFRWREHRLEQVDMVAGQPASLIWLALDKALA